MIWLYRIWLYRGLTVYVKFFLKKLIIINLKLIISFIIEVLTSYFKDRFIYIKFKKFKIVLLN